MRQKTFLIALPHTNDHTSLLAAHYDFSIGIVADNQKIIYFCFQNESKCQFYKYLIRW